MAGLSAEELAASLRAHLEGKGVLRGLKARLRRDIAAEFGPARTGADTGRGDRLRDSVVAEALRLCEYENAYAVFVPESGLGEERAFYDRSELAAALGLGSAGGDAPVLDALLRKAAASTA